MQLSKRKLLEKFEPYKGVLLFAFILMCSNYFWKFNVLGEESFSLHSKVTLWGFDISAPFMWMANHIAHLTLLILNTLGSDVILIPGNIFKHENGFLVQIVWACTGIKQAYIFFCILAFYHGPWKHKLWYIPLGLVVVYLFNVFRITFIIGAVEYRPDWFHFLHITAFKYLFYAVIFLMWVVWEEKFAHKPKVKNADFQPLD